MAKFYLTQEGVIKLKDEITHMKNVKRPEIAARVQTAREHGDLKENGEYHAAKEELQILQSRINELELKLMNVVIVKEEEIPTDKVYILATVELQNMKNKQKVTYTLVPDNEADIDLGKISVNTPIAMGLLGKSVGDIAKMKVPAGELEYKILKISRS